MALNISPAMNTGIPVPAAMARSIPMMGGVPGWQAAGIAPGASAYPGAVMGSMGPFGYGAGAPTMYSQQMLAQALGGTQLAQQESEAPSPIKSALKTALIGGAAGFAFGLIPFLPLGPISGAIVGTIAGGVIGFLRARSKAKRIEQDHTAEQMTAAQVQAQMNAQTPPGAVNINGPVAAGVTTAAGAATHARKRARRRAASKPVHAKVAAGRQRPAAARHH